MVSRGVVGFLETGARLLFRFAISVEFDHLESRRK